MHVTQHEYFAVFIAQRGEGLCELFPDFFPLQRFRRDLTPVREVARDVISLLVLATNDRLHHMNVFSALPHARLVERDLDEPRAEFRFASKLADVL